MNIEITKEEYGKLLDLLYVADWVLTSHKTGEDPRTEKHEKVIRKFYALAEEMGQGSKIEYDPDLEKFFPAKAMEESSEARNFLDAFAEETFWHELIYRFTERDSERKVGGYEKYITLSPGERFEIETPIEEKYLEEFEQNGIERLEIVERLDINGTKPVTSD